MNRPESATHPGQGALGLLESRSLARGYEAEDAACKAAHVRRWFSRALESGKHVLALRGEVDAVRTALRVGAGVLGGDRLAQLLLARPLPALFTAAQRPPRAPASPAALGLLECATVAGGFACADAALKHAEIELLRLRFGEGLGGRCLVVLGGAEDDVESAVFSVSELAERHGGLVRASVITGADGETVASAVGSN